MAMPAATVASTAAVAGRFRKHWLAALVAFGCAAVGITLGFHYPVAQPWMPVLFACFVAIFYIWPYSWLAVVPAILPIVGFAPWTGWLTFEETDLLILAVATAGNARLVFRPPDPPSQASQAEQGTMLVSGNLGLASVVITLFLLSLLASLFRGLADAGGFDFGWFQGYHEPMNSVRVAKSFVEALLLIVLWRALHRQDPERAQSLLSMGLVLGLAATSLATVWERLAFTGLLNYSSDYRTTGRFWEMHVGGAALDGYLALTVPFAVRELLATRSPARWCIAAGVCALAAYACLTTFSRGVYLAVPVGLFVLLVLQTQRRLRLAAADSVKHDPRNNWPARLAVLLLVAVYAALAGWMFQTSGYRGAGALLGAMTLMLPLASAVRPLPLRLWIAGGVTGLILSVLAGSFAWLAPKGVLFVRNSP